LTQGGQFNQLIELPHDFSSFAVMAGNCKKCFGENFSSKAGFTVGVRWPAANRVPRAVAKWAGISAVFREIVKTC
jgi:hypothetical protein